MSQYVKLTDSGHLHHTVFGISAVCNFIFVIVGVCIPFIVLNDLLPYWQNNADILDDVDVGQNVYFKMFSF